MVVHLCLCLVSPANSAPCWCLLSKTNLHLSGRSLWAHLVLCELPGWAVDAKLLQRVDDLLPGSNRDCAVQDRVQRVDAGGLRKRRRFSSFWTLHRSNSANEALQEVITPHSPSSPLLQKEEVRQSCVDPPAQIHDSD